VLEKEEVLGEGKPRFAVEGLSFPKKYAV